MNGTTTTGRIEAFVEKGQWDRAQMLIRRELTNQPENHWLLTQLSVTLYEQCRYSEALEPLVASLKIVPDCPLTLWNLAGTLDALDKPRSAIPIYSWLLRADPGDDPCWESDAWAESLKTDCVYRLGVCFQRLKRWASAANCFRQYINLLLAGQTGLYSLEEAATRIREINGKGGHRPDRDARAAFASTLRESGQKGKLPKLSLAQLLKA